MCRGVFLPLPHAPKRLERKRTLLEPLWIIPLFGLLDPNGGLGEFVLFVEHTSSYRWLLEILGGMSYTEIGSVYGSRLRESSYQNGRFRRLSVFNFQGTGF